MQPKTVPTPRLEEPTSPESLLSSTAPRELTMNDLSEADWEGLLAKGFRRTAGREEALGWDLPFLAFWLAEKPEHNVGMLGIRELVARVDCVEAGHYGREAQHVLTRPSEPPLARRKALSKSKAVPPEWDTNNFAVQALVFEVAQARYAAGTWRPAAWA